MSRVEESGTSDGRRAYRKGAPFCGSFRSLPGRASGGFTLLEVVIAMALLGLVIVAALQLVSGGLRTARLSGDYTMAMIHAREKMDYTLQDPTQGSGVFPDGFRWTAEVVPLGKAGDDKAELRKVTVTVSWGDIRKERKINLVSLKVGE